jgi:hypothetical protein
MNTGRRVDHCLSISFVNITSLVPSFICGWKFATLSTLSKTERLNNGVPFLDRHNPFRSILQVCHEFHCQEVPCRKTIDDDDGWSQIM